MLYYTLWKLHRGAVDAAMLRDEDAAVDIDDTELGEEALHGVVCLLVLVWLGIGGE